MIDPLKVLIVTPTYDGKVESAYAGGLAASTGAHLIGSFAFIPYCSDIRLARSMAVHRFLSATQYDWLVFIDADIGFTARDLRILLDYPPAAHDEPFPELPAAQVEPTRLDGHDVLVVAEYARKQDVPLGPLFTALAALRAGSPTTAAVQGLIDAADNIRVPEPTRFGLGFARIHRSVLERIIAMCDEDGAPRVGFFRDVTSGTDVPDIFPTGPGFNHLYHTEDHGFFFLARIADLIPRVETRTRLHHFGVKDFPYPAPALPPVKSATDMRITALSPPLAQPVLLPQS